ncbi:MAG TPA: hydroxysqualene dehydroxylase HpnE, partial [Tepidisphaeraceae bacterium]|nr:hydroxysqualene dehydroxylase HpnE [Tepidisphaeraceae bacterium]
MTTALLPSHDRHAVAGTPPRVIVIGGGLAGMAATVALESAGAQVTLIESRRFLGGRATSFQDPQTGQMLDNGQHVLLGCCTNLRDFYHRLNASHLIRYERAIHFRDVDGRQHDIWSVPGLPAPLHLAAALAGFSPLSLRDRLAVVRAMTAMIRLSPAHRQQLSDLPFDRWLKEHRQSPTVIEQFYNPVLIGSLNDSLDRVSAAYAIQVFQDAMLAHRSGYVVGVASCPLAQLYQQLPCSDLRLGVRAIELQFRDRILSAVKLQSGQVLTADAFVLATNRHALTKLLPESIRRQDTRFAHLGHFEDVPILSAFLQFDRPVLAQTHAAMLAGPLQWLFRKDRAGRVLQGVISAAREWVGRPPEQCLRLFEQQIQTMLPHARGAHLQHGRIIIEKRATYSPSPGIDRFRPPQAPPPAGISNL